MNTKTLRFFSWITLAFLPINTVFAVPAGQITQASGYVAVSSPQTAPKSVGNGTPIESGQVVTLGKDSSAVIKFQDGQIIALQSKSIFKVNSYKYDQAAPQKGESFFSLLEGGLRAITGLIGNNNREGWKLATPTMTIGIRGTDFMSVVNVNRRSRQPTAPVPQSLRPARRDPSPAQRCLEPQFLRHPYRPAPSASCRRSISARSVVRQRPRRRRRVAQYWAFRPRSWSASV